MIRVVVADHHTTVREGLKQLLSAAGNLDVVGEAQDGDEVLDRVRALDFDLLLLDISMPGKSAIDLIRHVKAVKPGLRILVLIPHEAHPYAVRAIRAGAAGYLTKASASRQVVEAIRKIASGESFIGSDVAQRLAPGDGTDGMRAPHESLSDREFQVFLLVAGGKSVADIAEQLDLSVKTVGTHKASVLQKMGMTTQAEVIRYAWSNRLLDESGAE